jgi:sigma-B regulation protein RsbQ
MSVQQRHHVKVGGKGSATMVFAHGFGCDQNMWRMLEPSFAGRYRTVLYDLVGSGQSDLAAYDRQKYGTLHGHAQDLIDVVDEFASGPVVVVGHSVSAVIGMLACIERPSAFSALVMVGPSPCYINDGDYVGGFTREDIEGLLETMESNYLGWSSNMAPAIMGAPGQPELATELTNSFCRTDPDIARHFARVTFLSDHRADCERLRTPSLILQCSDDLIAPISVGEYMHKVMPQSRLEIIENVGHCPHMSAPSASANAMNTFLAQLDA